MPSSVSVFLIRIWIPAGSVINWIRSLSCESYQRLGKFQKKIKYFKTTNYLVLLTTCFSSGHKNVQQGFGSESGSVIIWPPGSVFVIQIYGSADIRNTGISNVDILIVVFAAAVTVKMWR
jgi:hypothetical protein